MHVGFMVREVLLLLAAAAAGAVNSVAGGGTLITFPTLIWLGLGSISANAAGVSAAELTPNARARSALTSSPSIVAAPLKPRNASRKAETSGMTTKSVITASPGASRNAIQARRRQCFMEGFQGQ